MCIRDRDYAEEASLSNFLEEISLQTDIDNYDAEADSSVMMTLHSAKAVSYTHLDVYKRQNLFCYGRSLFTGL